MSTKVIPMGLPTKSPRKTKKAPNLEEEIAKYGFELRPQRTPRDVVDAPSLVRENNFEKKDVTCESDPKQWIDNLLDYGDNIFDTEQLDKVNTINIEGCVSGWELSVPNPQLVKKVRRSKQTLPGPDEPIVEPHVTRSKEVDFVDAPAWRICVDPNTYSYIPNNGRYRASKLVKKVDPQRYALRKYPESRTLAPERQHLQREIQRELRTEFEMYLKQEKEKMDAEEEAERPRVEITSAQETDSSRADEVLDTGESDLEQFEAKEWRDNQGGSKQRDSKKVKIEGPTSVLKVSTSGSRNHGKSNKTKVLPPLDQAGTGLTGDQFLNEVSSKLLSWEKERRGVPRTSLQVNTSVDIDNSQPNSSREHRSKSEPPTISEIIDRHQNRAGLVVDTTQDNGNFSMNYGSVRVPKSSSQEDQVRYRLPKQRTENYSMADHVKRHLSQNNSAPMERLGVQESSMFQSQSSEYLSKLPPRGESIPIRTPLKALQPGTKTPISEAVFSVRKLSNPSSASGSPRQNSGMWGRRTSWDYDDHAIDIVSKHQVLKDTPVSSPPTLQRKVTVLRHAQSMQSNRLTAGTNPLSAIAVVNQVKYTPETASRFKNTDSTMDQSSSDVIERENSIQHHSLNTPEHMIPMPSQPLKMLITATKVNTNKPKKTAGKGTTTGKMVDKPKPDTGNAKKVDSAKAREMDCNSIGVSGKKISYQEATQRII